MLYSNNTWVVGAGEAYMVNFLGGRSRQAYEGIRSMELYFSWEDSCFWPEYRVKYARDKWTESVYNGTATTSARQGHHGPIRRTFETAPGFVTEVWTEKFRAVSSLRLDHLTLDLTLAVDIEEDLPGSASGRLGFPAFK